MLLKIKDRPQKRASKARMFLKRKILSYCERQNVVENKGGAKIQNSGQDRGYVLLILMMAVTILLVSLTAALPSIYVEGQREREEELIFRGNQYARAIAFFQRRFGRYPTSVDELLRTNGIRFLRRAYPDPMSPDGKWRFIHTAASGAVLNSRTLGSIPGAGKPADSSSGTAPEKSARSRRLEQKEDEQSKGTFITGVASSSHKESIRIWKNHTHYDEWEFLGVEVVPAALQAPAASGVGTSQGRGAFSPRTPQEHPKPLLKPSTEMPTNP